MLVEKNYTILVVSVPLKIHKDQGINFEIATYSKICQLMNIKKTRTKNYLIIKITSRETVLLYRIEMDTNEGR